MPIWECEDCHKIGFYFDITAKEMIEKHKKECESQPAPTETLADYSDFVNFSDIPAHWQKKPWVPDWLWCLVARKEFDV